MMRRLIALCAALSLTGCSSDPNASNAASTFRQVATQLTNQSNAGESLGGVSADGIAQVLAATPKPVLLLAVERAQAQSLFVEIARNGAYATYGTANRLSATTRGGMITATRGLGGDLMSSDARALLSALRNGGGSSVPYTLEFVDGEDRPRVLAYRCNVAAAGTTRVTGGQIDAPVTQYAAACTSPDAEDFANTFMVSSAGTVLAARQWLGEFIGYTSMQHMRR